MTSINHSTNNAGSTGASNDNGGRRKLQGAVEVVHGIGENIRGRFLGAVDSNTNNNAAHPEIEGGRREVEHGFAKLTGGPGVAADGLNHTHTPRASTTSNATGPSSHNAPLGQEGNAPGPASAATAGITAGGPETTLAEGAYQPHAAGSDGGAEFQGGRNDRDFHPGGGAEQAGPAPDRNTLSRSPQRLG